MNLILENRMHFETWRKDLYYLENTVFFKDTAHNYLFPMKQHTVS